MISKARYWMGIGKPKNQHSLDNLKYKQLFEPFPISQCFLDLFYFFFNFKRYLFGILNKNQTVSENNKDLLIETLRSISEILIWGDQNDSSVFE